MTSDECTFVKKQKPGQGPLAGVPLLEYIRSHIDLDLDQCLSLVGPIFTTIRGSRRGSSKYIHQGKQYPPDLVLEKYWLCCC